MRLAEAARVAAAGLRANRLRSGLTMLGVIIGVAAVVVLVAIGTGTRQEVERQVSGLGSNLLLIFPGEASVTAAPPSPGSRSTTRRRPPGWWATGTGSRCRSPPASGTRRHESEFTSVLGTLDTSLEVFRASSAAVRTSAGRTWTPPVEWWCSASTVAEQLFRIGTRSAGR